MNKLSKTLIGASVAVAAVGSMALGAVAADAAETSPPAQGKIPAVSTGHGNGGTKTSVPATPGALSNEKPNIVYQDDTMSISGAPGVTADDVNIDQATGSVTSTK